MRRIGTFVLAVLLAAVTPPALCRDEYTDGVFYKTELGLSELPLIPPDAEAVWLNNNSLTSLRAGDFAGLGDATFLGLHHNFISYIEPGAFEGLDKLDTLWLNGNMLRRLEPNTFRGLPSLSVYLQFYGNRIDQIDANAFNGLDKLKVVNLNNNRLTDIRRDMFQGLDSLVELILTDNRIRSVRDRAFSEMPELIELWMDTNRMTDLRYEMFIGIEDSLERFALHNNNLTYLRGGVLNGLHNLEVLDLDQNNITEIRRDAFRGMDKLEEIWLYENKLSALPMSAFQDLPRPLDVTIGANPLDCDESLCWLTQDYITWLEFPPRERFPTCVDGTTWTAFTAACPREDKEACDDPGEVLNARRFASNTGLFEPGHQVTYVCDFCYTETHETGELTCRSDYEWSGDRPTCTQVTCPDPGAVDHAGQAQDPSAPRVSYQCLDTATFSCQPGFRLVGAPAVTCLPSGEWNKPKPYCVETSAISARPKKCEDEDDDINVGWLTAVIAAGVGGFFVGIMVTAICMSVCLKWCRGGKQEN